MTDACRVTGSKKERLSETFTALHEGQPPKEFICEKLPEKQLSARPIGRITEIQYWKRIPDDEPRYHHPFAEQAQPTVGVDRNGQLVIYSGRYETTIRGIEDRVSQGMTTVKWLKKPYVQRERLPPSPKSLITLGTLEWIRYDLQTETGTTSRTLEFSKSIAPIIAHDESGNLHLLHGQYGINDSGEVEKKMRHARKHSRRSKRRHHRRSNPVGLALPNPRHGHRARHTRGHSRRHRFLALMNPTAMSVGTAGEPPAERAWRMILGSVIVGGVATVTAIGLNAMFSMPTFATTDPNVIAASKIGIGILGGLAFGFALPSVPALAAGIGVGGLIDGLLDLWSMYGPGAVKTVAVVPAATLPATTPVAVTSGSTPVVAASQVRLPDGVPAAYAGYSPAACGVA